VPEPVPEADFYRPPRHDVPSGGRSCFTIVEGRQVHYLEWGNGRRGTVVALHGGGQSAYMFEELGAALRGRFRVVAPDLPEHGDSDPLLDGDWGRHGLARSVLAFLAELGIDRAAFVGASVGGITSITVGVLVPRLLESLVLIDVAPNMEAAGRARLIEFFTKVDSFASLEEAAQTITEFLPSRKNVRAENLARSLRQTPDGRWIWKHGLGRRQKETAEQEPYVGTAIDPILEGLNDDARTLTCPALILRGAKSDLLTEEAAFQLADSLRQAEVGTVAGGGHMAVGDNPTASITMITDFLTRHPPSP
jgi:pimeloyl-ACP methyl ester carboxylesterase